MKKTIGGRCFELCKGEYKPVSRYWALYDAYEKPSVTKCCIWEEWCNWFYSMAEKFNYATDGEYDYISICSRNCFRFSINGRITVDGITYTFLITQTRNELYYV